MKVIFVLFLTISVGSSKTLPCRDLLRLNNIDPKVKSYRGWRRVCNNDKLFLYTKHKLTKEDKNALCSCFVDSSKNRDLYLRANSK